MAFSKSKRFPHELQHTAFIQKAMCHPARIQILMMLADHRLPVYRMVRMMPLCRATISHHLRVLREAGLIKAHGEGPNVEYEIVKSGCRHAGKVLSRFAWDFLLRIEEGKEGQAGLKT